MATASHLHRPVDPSASSGPFPIARTLHELERSLSGIASQTAMAADSLHAEHAGRRPGPEDADVASWWLDRLVRAALATRDTCRAARAAIGDAGLSDGDDGSGRPPRGGSADAAPHALGGRRKIGGRWIVVGYDGSAAAERALHRAAAEAGERDAVVIVTTAAQVYSAGPAAEPLLEPTAEPSVLLAAARETVVARCPVADVVVVAREGDLAEQLLEVARAANADLVIVGRRGTDFVARALLGSVARRVVEQAPCDVLVVA